VSDVAPALRSQLNIKENNVRLQPSGSRERLTPTPSLSDHHVAALLEQLPYCFPVKDMIVDDQDAHVADLLAPTTPRLPAELVQRPDCRAAPERK
jgi:hypothetical protein